MYGLHVSGESLKQLLICDNICGKSDIPYQLVYDAQHHAQSYLVAGAGRAD